MKAKVICAYTDRETGEVHTSGQTVELSEARAQELMCAGFVEAQTCVSKTSRAKTTKKDASSTRTRSSKVKP